MVRPFAVLLWLACLLAPFLAFSQTSSSDFSFVLLPDTQNEAQYFPNVLSSQTQWIVNNRSQLNIQAVLGLGDIVNDGADPAQQTNADTAIRQLDNAGIPYFLGIGNHDYDGGEDDGVVARAVTGFNQWFGPARYAGKDYYKGNFPSGSNENFYGVLTINGKQYLILVLEYIPRTTSLDWAASIVQANPDKEVIVVTHSFLFVDGTTADRCDTQDKPRKDNDGEQMWDYFVSKYPNIIMVVNGHLTAGEAARRSDLGINGNLVNSMFSNYQTDANGGNGWLRIVTFHPSANTISVQTYSPFLNSYRTDATNQFTVNYHNPGFNTGFGTITGRVTGSGCQIISGATVSAGGVSTSTDEHGRFSLKVAPGTYQVSVSAPNWQNGTRSVKVNDNFSTDINFYLTSPPPCSLQATGRSMTWCAPTSGATVDSPVHVVAATSEPVLRIGLWEGGNKLLEVPGNVVDANLALGSGHHDVIAVGVEVDTSQFSNDVSFDVGSTAPPPRPLSDFALSVSPASQTVKRGQSATYGISIAAQNGSFDDAVALACSGLAAGMSCNFSPTSVIPGTGTATATLTLATTTSVASATATALPFSGFAIVCACVFPLAGGFLRGHRRKGFLKFGSLCVILALGLTLESCGGGGATAPQTSSPSTSSSGGGGGDTAPLLTSTVTLVATSGSTTHSTTVTLMVQQ
ncbi:MAG TPA: carboxypeptidase regulatory-like domain-containing protein [Candidatus Sulfotelmatobacter sp.]|nr:carboxypeptidase regulatory-like domain-containing protein [Candidatus Sulfotelmatobacter sp.]